MPARLLPGTERGDSFSTDETISSQQIGTLA
jgi:hypothetical protein